MSVIQDSEYVLYKAVAQHVKDGLVRPLNIINLKCLKEFSKFEKQKALFLNCETFEDLGDNSKKFKNDLKNLISLLAVQDRLEKISKRNEQRIEFISFKLQQMGIYNDAVDKKTISNALSAETKNISTESLNLNPKSNRGITFKFFNGRILAFRDDELDFDLDENKDVLIEGSVEFIHSVVETFPYSVGTIPDEYYILSDLKNKILKECILYAASKIKTQTIAESNKQLGGLLERAGELTSIVHFANELKNYFNVIVKQTLKEQAPELEVEIDAELKCNEASIFLPKDRRVVDDTPAEIEEISDNSSSETEQKDVEKESATQNESQNDEEDGMSTKELLNLLMDDEDDLEDGMEEDSETKEVNKPTEDDELDSVMKELNDLFGDDEKDEESEKTGVKDPNVSDGLKPAEEPKNEEQSIDEDIDNILKELEDLFDSDDEDKNEG